MEQALNRNKIIAELTKSPHGNLEAYAPVGLKAVAEDPAFFSHLIAWNASKGVIRDSQVALPVLAMATPALWADEGLRDNALAHLGAMNPRMLLQAVTFSKEHRPGSVNALKRIVVRYLRDKESSKSRFDRVALQHREVLKSLYGSYGIKPGSDRANVILFGRRLDKTKATPEGVFGVLAHMKEMEPAAAAAAIMQAKIPFLAAQGALGAKAKDPVLVQALIGAMTPTEVVTNAKALERLGVKTDPGLRATFEAALAKAAESGKAVLKTTRAAEAVGGSVGEKLRGVQEKQLDKLSVKGNWLVLADKSGSMAQSIETARHVAAVLARVGEGHVHLVFYDSAPSLYVDATGLTLEQLTEKTKRVQASGGTLPGSALQFALDRKFEVDGIAMVTDANENPGAGMRFTAQFQRLSDAIGKVPPVYVYQVKGDEPNLLKLSAAAGIDLQVFDLRGGVDYYSLPALVQTMRVNRYDLVQEILDTPLLRLTDVFKLAA